MAKSLAEIIAEKKKNIDARKGRQRPAKITKGKHRVRILPSWRPGGEDPTFWHDFGQHFIKNEAGEISAVYICTENTFGQPCDVCDAIRSSVKSANSDAQIKTLDEAKSGAPKYLVNALIRSGDKPNEPQVLELGTQAFEAILGIVAEFGDITDINNGADLIIERTGSGRNDTRYTVMPAAKHEPVKKEVLDKLTDLDEYVAQENETGLTKALTAVANVAGVLPAGGSAVGVTRAPASAGLMSPSTDFDDDVPFEEGEYIDAEPAAQAEAPAADASAADSVGEEMSEDDLDALVQGL